MSATSSGITELSNKDFLEALSISVSLEDDIFNDDLHASNEKSEKPDLFTKALARAIFLSASNLKSSYGLSGDLTASIKSLIADGANVNYVAAETGMPLIAYAARNGDIDLCLMLMEHGATLGSGSSNKKANTMMVFLQWAPKLLIECYSNKHDLISSATHAEFQALSGIYADYNEMAAAIADIIDPGLSGLLELNSLEDGEIQFDDGKAKFTVFNHALLEKAMITERGRGREMLKTISQSGCERSLSAIVDDDIANKIRALENKFPNFKEAIDSIVRAAMLSTLSTDARFNLPKPLLLVGPPGVGKTKFLSSLSSIIGTEFSLIGCSAVTAGWVIGGSSPSWSEGKSGMVLATLRDGKTANPIIMLDEIDKLSGDSRYDGYGPLYSLLEKGTAKTFIDESIGIPFDCSQINWVGTANELHPIPEPILSRFTTINVPAPSKDQLMVIAISVYADILEDNKHTYGGRFSTELDEGIIDYLSDMSPREMRGRIMEAMGNAAVNRKVQIYDLNTEDFALPNRIKNNGIGFLKQ